MGYVTRSLGLTLPEGPHIYEVFLRVKSRPGVLGRIDSLLGSMNIDLLGAHGQVHESGEATIILYADLGKATTSLEEALARLREEEPVLEVSAKPNEPIFFEHFYFPLTSGGRFPVFVISVDSWLTFEEELLKRFGTPAEALLHEIGRSIGRAAVRKMRKRPMGTPITTSVLHANFVEMFRAFGLGLLEIIKKDASYEVSIREPLMSYRETQVIDSFSVGLVTGALEEIYGGTLAVRNLSYRRDERTLAFTLQPS
jgi:hypothetical protein